MRSPKPACHAVQVYRDVRELADSVGEYLACAFEAGDPAILIATDAHRAVFLDAVRDRWAGDVAGSPLLTMFDAEETLDLLMEGGLPSAQRFDAVAGGAVDEIARCFPGRTIRAFGEMVDILSHRGEVAAAHALEQLWNGLAETRPIALLCGYELDLFDRSAQLSQLPGVCRTHTHVMPAADVPRLTRAVDYALEEVLGPARTVTVYLSAQRQMNADAPLPQLALMWVTSQLPADADEVLAVARERYTAAAA